MVARARLEAQRRLLADKLQSLGNKDAPSLGLDDDRISLNSSTSVSQLSLDSMETLGFFEKPLTVNVVYVFVIFRVNRIESVVVRSYELVLFSLIRTLVKHYDKAHYSNTIPQISDQVCCSNKDTVIYGFCNSKQIHDIMTALFFHCF